MKKLKKIFAVSLLTLSLVGCSRNENTSSTSTETPTSEKTSTKASSSKESSVSSSTSSSSSSSTSSSPSIYDTTKWSNDVVDYMLKYLGNQLIPYLKLSSKEKNVTASYITSTSTTTEYYLQLEGDITVDTTFIANAISTYQSEGWTITAQTSVSFSASLESAKLKISVTADSLGYPQVKVYYDEPYDATSATSWNQDVLDIFNNYCGGHQVPFFYMGTANAWAGTWYSSSNYGYIWGNHNYSDDIVENAKAALTSADGWTTTEGSTLTYNYKTLTAEKTFEDGCKITLTLQSASSTSNRPRLKVEFKEKFDINDYTAWDSYVDSIFKNYYGHSLPVIYLGTATVTSTFSDSTYVLTLTGGRWDDQVLTNAKSVLANDTNAAGTSYWTVQEGSNSYGNMITATRENYDDGCAVSFTISGTSTVATSSKCKMVVTFIPKVDIPTTATTWSADVQTKLATSVSNYADLTPLDGHELPYVYLNTTSETAIVSFGTTFRRLQITGGAYNPNIIETAISTYTTAGWTVEKLVNATYSSNIGFKAVKQFDHYVDGVNHPCEITATIAAPSSSTPLNSTMYLYAYLNEGFGSSSYTEYDQDIKDDLKDYFNNFDLPVFYLGSKVIFNSMTASTKTEVLSGGSWDDSLWDSVKSTLENDVDSTGNSRWTITDKSDNDATPKLKATCDDGTKGTVKITFYKYSSSYYVYPLPYMTVQYVDKIDTSATGAWTDAIKTKFKTLMGDENENVIPYTNLNSTVDNLTVGTPSTSLGYLSITGGVWDETVLDLAKTTYEAAGWTCSKDKYSYSYRFVAIKELDDGSYVRVIIYKSSASDTSAKCQMYISFYKATTLTDTSTSWSASNVTTMKDTLNGNTIPYFYTKSTQVTFTSYTNTTYGYSYIYSTGLEGNLSVGLAAQATLNSDGWTTSWSWLYSTAYYSNFKLTATKKVTGGKLFLIMYKSGTSCSLGVSFSKDITLDNTTSYTFPSDSNTRLQSLFGVTLPNIYIGVGNPYESYSLTSGYYRFYGLGYSDTLTSDAKTLFDNAGWSTEIVDVSSNPLYASISAYAEGDMLIAKTTSSYGTVYCYIYEYVYHTAYTGYEYPVIDVRLA